MLVEDPTQPVFTWYDDVTGERIELSGATLENWVAKTANLLVDGLGLGPGDRAAVLLPPHWQTAAVLLGCRAAGLAVETGADAVDVVFAAADRVDEARVRVAGDRFVLGLAPMALPMRSVPEGFADFVVEVRGHGDRFLGPPAPPVDDQARERAAALGIGKGDRVLIDAAVHPDPLDWLFAPLAAGATVVLCGHLDRAKLPSRVSAERVTSELV